MSALRVLGHARESIATRGGLIGSCSCGATLSPAGQRGQNGRNVTLGLFAGYHAREALRAAHEAHKAQVVAVGASK